MENNGKIGCSNSKVKIIDPNDFNGMSSTDNVSVPLEDLNISVVLRTKRKGRTVLSSDGDVDTKESNGTVEINFIEGTEINGKKVLTSKFTDLTTVYDSSFNDETLGISSIDIDFNPSMAPMITINFIDVRGSSIFQNEKYISGNNSSNKYATFFQLPYPLFELEIKGYFGLPVTYCLHMLKFTTKFNSKTGNFEIQCQFIGYTYAMLSDMLIGYLRAIKETKIGAEIYKAKNDERIANGGLEIIGLAELSQKISAINDGVDKLASESEASKALNSIEAGNKALDKVKEVLDVLGSSLDIEQGNTKDSYNFMLTKGLDNKDIIVKNYVDNIKKSIKDFNDTNSGYSLDDAIFTNIDSKGFDKGFYTDLTKKMFEQNVDNTESDKELASQIGSNDGFIKFKSSLTKYLNTYYKTLEKPFDVYNMTSLYDEIIKARFEIDKVGKSAKELLAKQLKNTVRKSLGFEPTVRNIVEIFTFAAEVLMETIYKVSEAAAKKDNTARTTELATKFNVNLLDNTDLKENVIKENIFHPWPDYREKDETTKTFVEKYLGTPGVLQNPKNVNELDFIDDLLKAFIKSKKKIDEIDASLEAESNTWYPVNPLDTNLSISTDPYSRLTINNQIDLMTIMIIRGMTFLGYSNDEKTLTDDEILTMASLEVDAIFRGIKDDTLKQSLTLITLDTIKKASNIVNGKDSKMLTFKDGRYFYNYLFPYVKGDSGVSTRLILPVSDSFKGEWVNKTANLINKKNKGSKFLSNDYPRFNNQNNAANSITRFDDGGIFMEIMPKDEYPTTSKLYASDVEINTESVLVLDKLKSETILDAKSAGFNTFGGPLGIQDFSKMDFGAKGLEDLPLRFIFFNDKPKGGGLALTRAATLKEKSLKSFKIQDDVKSNGIIKLNNQGSYYTDNESNYLHSNLSNNRRLFNILTRNSSIISYPYIYVSVDATPNGDDGGVAYGSYYESTSVDNKFSLFGSKFYYNQDTAYITLKNKKPFYTKNYSRALLFLNSLPWIGNGFGVDGDRYTDPDPINEIMHLFDIRAGFVHAPKLWCAYVGGILWRIDTSYPIIENGVITGGGSTKKDPIIWKFDKKAGFVPPTKNQYFPSVNLMNKSYQNITPSDGAEAGDMIRRMPVQVQNEFKRIFFEFVNGTGTGVSWKDLSSKLEIFNGSSTLFKKFIDDNSVQDKEEIKAGGFKASRLNKLINKENYSKILFNYSGILDKHSLFLELADNSVAVKTLLNALLEESIIANNNYKIWRAKSPLSGIAANGGGEEIYTTKTNFDKYFGAIVKKLSEKGNSYSPTEAKKADELELFGTANEDIIKLLLYKNCKNIYDKWLAGVKDPKKIIFQCGINTRNVSDEALGLKYGNKTPSLIDSFRFVSRSFKDIGDKLYINPLPINDYLSNDQNTSLYDAVSSLLTSNKFTFEALPTFINFRDDENVKAIFKPYGNYGEALKAGTCGPSFVCVYAGQPSKHLDFTNSEYQNDGFDLNCVKGGVNPNIPDDFKSITTTDTTKLGFENQDVKEKTETNGVSADIGGSEDPIAVFTVRYGQQNQNIFKDVELDQSEFTETDESLQIQDEISQKGGENNRTIAGQNIYNVYSVRSYTAKVEMMGNAMIQPMMYFQLDNIPMFHGAYMVTRVQHSIIPNSMKTTFSGTRVRFSETPLMTAYDLYMSFADSINTGDAGVGTKPIGSVAPIVGTIVANGGLNSNIVSGNIKTTKVGDTIPGIKFELSPDDRLLDEAVKPLREMLKDWAKWMDDQGFKPLTKRNGENIYGYITSLFRVNTYNSPHGWGIAVDLQMPNKDGIAFGNNNDTGSKPDYFNFKTNPALGWLYRHSYEYGFVQPFWANDGTSSGKGKDEHWHWEYHGKSAICMLRKKPIPGYGGNNISDNPLSEIKESKIKSFVKNPKGSDGKEAVYTDCEYKTILESDADNNINANADTTSKDSNVWANQARVKSILKGKGFNKYQVAGIMGNIHHETGGTWNPKSLNKRDKNNYTSYGLIQWNQKFKGQEISSIGDTIDKQMEFLVKMSTFKKWANLDEPKTSVNESAYQFANIVEVCDKCNQGFQTYKGSYQYPRTTYANDYFKRFNDKNDKLAW